MAKKQTWLGMFALAVAALMLAWPVERVPIADGPAIADLGAEIASPGAAVQPSEHHTEVRSEGGRSAVVAPLEHWADRPTVTSQPPAAPAADAQGQPIVDQVASDNPAVENEQVGSYIVFAAAYTGSVNIRVGNFLQRTTGQFGLPAGVSFVPASVTCAPFVSCPLSNANQTVTIQCHNANTVTQTWNLSNGDTFTITITCFS